ncbi:hypothetical protein [Paraburkholderia humisilvae]|uniref:Uncharacterized protein n=1 Tax=Paraburkholderia humisilvae TaxID=627669 RepID=A0A6J5EVP9_9BURK|nr:hypothetical protein [Paraburkholderia humisilvae]CAB3770668.1 hypothetical protein LMG29542_06416 [Paraburkholderia humisilvae]
MDLTNWIIMLAIAWIAVAFFCLRRRADWSIENRARRRAGMRLIAQAVFALWSATLIVLRGLALTSAHRMPDATPLAMLIAAALLSACGAYWLIRGARLLKARRLFAAC